MFFTFLLFHCLVLPRYWSYIYIIRFLGATQSVIESMPVFILGVCYHVLSHIWVGITLLCFLQFVLRFPLPLENSFFPFLKFFFFIWPESTQRHIGAWIWWTFLGLMDDRRMTLQALEDAFIFFMKKDLSVSSIYNCTLERWSVWDLLASKLDRKNSRYGLRFESRLNLLLAYCEACICLFVFLFLRGCKTRYLARFLVFWFLKIWGKCVVKKCDAEHAIICMKNAAVKWKTFQYALFRFPFIPFSSLYALCSLLFIYFRLPPPPSLPLVVNCSCVLTSI